MKRLFFSLVVFQCCFFGFSPLIGDSIEMTPEQIKGLNERELLLVDEQVQSLTNLRDYYASKAARYQSRADRYKLRGNQEHLELSKDLTAEANNYKNIVSQLDEEIATLEKQRAALLKKVG